MFILLFFALITAVSMFVLMQTTLVETTATAYAERDRMVAEQNTKVLFLNASYNNMTDTSTFYVKNTGTVMLELDTMDIYIDDKKVPRDEANRTISFQYSVNNPLHWDPDEILVIDVHMSLGQSQHVATINTQNGGKDSIGYIA